MGIKDLQRTIELLDDRFSRHHFDFLRKPVTEDDSYTYHIILNRDFVNVNDSASGCIDQCKYFAFPKDKPDEVFLCYKESEEYKLMNKLGAFKFQEWFLLFC